MARRSGDRKQRVKDVVYCNVYSSQMSLGARKISVIDSCVAERRVSEGTAMRLYRLDGDFYLEEVEGAELAGYMLCNAPAPPALKPSSLFLSRREVDLIAGRAFRDGQSHTDRFGDDEESRIRFALAREKQTGRVHPLEDDIERAGVKLELLNPRYAIQDRIVSVAV